MALFLTESEVLELFPMERAIERIESSFIAQHQGEAINRSRERIFLPHSSLHYMAAALPADNLLGMKIYTVTRSAWRFVVLLFDAASGALLAVLEADHLGRIRTGAASGVATKFMARRDASCAGVIGTGRQARTQLEAVARVRKLTEARVFGRDEKRRRDFCKEMTERLGFTVEPVESAEAAVRPADIVIAMGPHGTNSRVFFPALGSRLTYAHVGHHVVSGQLAFQQTFTPAVIQMAYRLPHLETAMRNYGVTLTQVVDRHTTVPELQLSKAVLRATAYRTQLFEQFERVKEALLP